jgi:crotonobetainyl-CoA:carnitine CoA-transferase CaiB-like acyl-CoA transferase
VVFQPKQMTPQQLANCQIAAFREFYSLASMWQRLSVFPPQKVAWLINAGQYYLTSGELPPRLGNGHPNIVPYEVFPASDGHFILTVGNDAQFRKLCECAQIAQLADDPRFATNASRVRNRDLLIPILKEVTARKPVAHWIEALERLRVPCGPVNRIDQVFADPQVKHRGMRVTVDYPGSATGAVDLIGSPLRLSETPVRYRRAPPCLGQHSDEACARCSIAMRRSAAARRAGARLIQRGLGTRLRR